MTRLKLALFDVDGTLVDSQGHIQQAMIAGFAAIGVAPPSPEAVRAIVGLSLPVAVAELAPGLDPDAQARAVEAYKDAYAAMRGADAAASSPLFPGAMDCLDRLSRQDEVLLGVATGKSRRGLTHVLDLHGLTGRFVTTQVADDHPSKPHPAMALAALSATGVTAQDAVMIGDTSFDIEMGRAAGMATLGVAWGNHAPEALERAGADRIAWHFDEVAGLLAELWERDDG